jgi:hypothetical protein
MPEAAAMPRRESMAAMRRIMSSDHRAVRFGSWTLELFSCWACGGKYLSVFRETYIDVWSRIRGYGTSDAR